MNSKVQFRGNCQCCGRDHAVNRGSIAKHGYNVEHGYFQGGCGGWQFAPLQADREVADQVVVSCRADALKLDKQQRALKAGRAFPKFARDERDWRSHDKNARIQVLWADGSDHDRSQALSSAIWACESRAKQARDFATFLEDMANKVHGTELREVARIEAPAPIYCGDKRVSHDRVVKAYRVDGRRIYYRDENGRGSWMAPKLWRELPVPNSTNHTVF